MTSEFSRIVDIRHLPERLRLEADAGERAALARRFEIEAIERLAAEVTLAHDNAGVSATGRIEAEIVQACAVSGDPFPARIAEPMALRFIAGQLPQGSEGEVEIDSAAEDEIAFEGHQFDLGEAIAQSLSLAIDPYATGPEADRARKDAGIVDEAASGPFAALAALKK